MRSSVALQIASSTPETMGDLQADRLGLQGDRKWAQAAWHSYGYFLRHTPCALCDDPGRRQTREDVLLRCQASRCERTLARGTGAARARRRRSVGAQRRAGRRGKRRITRAGTRRRAIPERTTECAGGVGRGLHQRRGAAGRAASARRSSRARQQSAGA